MLTQTNNFHASLTEENPQWKVIMSELAYSLHKQNLHVQLLLKKVMFIYF